VTDLPFVLTVGSSQNHEPPFDFWRKRFSLIEFCDSVLPLVTSILFEILRVTTCHGSDTAILKPIPVNYFYHTDFDIQSSTKTF
jgi:hypothetical protein